MSGSNAQVEKAYEIARERYASLGVDTDKAIKTLEKISLSINCWQGDDVTGFESGEGLSGGGIQATGNYPGRARNPDELSADAEKVFSLLPGRHRFSLHAIYLVNEGQKVERNKIRPEHFDYWVKWAKENDIGLDFNPTCFSHPMADSGFTLSSYDKGVRDFWIEHCLASREISEYMGKETDGPCVMNVWIPDGFKDTPANRQESRRLLIDSLDKIFAEKSNPQHELDAVESKLFGIGAESCTVGSHDFYLCYAMTRNLLLTMDTGHYHPTESVADKISSVLLYLDSILLHISRPVRWDSDHVVTFSDSLRELTREIVWGGFLDRVHLGLDFFDASINRIAAWVIGSRCTLKGFLYAALAPTQRLNEMEREGDNTGRLAMLEGLKTAPFGAVWDYYCHKHGAPTEYEWFAEVEKYERDVLSERT